MSIQFHTKNFFNLSRIPAADFDPPRSKAAVQPHFSFIISSEIFIHFRASG